MKAPRSPFDTSPPTRSQGKASRATPGREILICQQDEVNNPGIAPGLMAEAGLGWAVSFPGAARAVPFDPARHAGVLVLGGGDRSADDGRCYRHERRVVRAAVAAGRPVLGVCLGAQLVALVCGGGVARGGEADLEKGWRPVALTAEGADDPVVGHMAPVADTYQWHWDRCVLPPGAVRLAVSADSPDRHVEAFRVGASVYGLQFHPVYETGWRPSLPEFAGISEAKVSGTVAQGRAVFEAWIGLCR